MENERHSKVSSKSHLPEEVCREILLRLPVKSLLRFRCVSKSWLSLINDPEFCRVHLKTFKNNRDETHLLVVQGSQQQRDCVVRCSDTFKTRMETIFTLSCGLGVAGGNYHYHIKCSVNGLFLIEKKVYRRASDVMVWNPSIRKFHDIPSSPEIDSSVKEVGIGLGYHQLVKDYKHVKLIFKNPNSPPSVAIYTLGTRSWKIIQFKGKGFSDFAWDFDFISSQPVYLRGSLYFLAINVEMDVLELVSFDLNSEVFCSISLPDPVAYMNANIYCFEEYITLVRYGCSSLAVFNCEGRSTSMWVMECESMCWTEPYLLSLVFVPKILYLKKNRDMLIWWCCEEMPFSLATPYGLGDSCSLVSSFNLGNKKEKILLLKEFDLDFEITEAHGYIESLVLRK